jgi:hypothetical protein
LAVKPGRELDALLHEKHFGLCHHSWDRVTGIVFGGEHHSRQCSKCKALEPLVVHSETPPYSTDITAAWTVMEHERRRGGYICLSPLPNGQWRAVRSKALNPKGDGTADDYDDTYPDFHVLADTAPMAICMAVGHFFLDEAVMDEFTIGCFVCGTVQAKGHEPGCAVADLSLELQGAFGGKRK